MKPIRRAFITGVFHVRVEEFDQEWIMPQYHFHEPYEVYVMTSGSRSFVIDGSHYSLSAGDAILFPSGCFHKVYSRGHVRGLCYHFSEKYLLRFFTPSTVRQLLACFDRNTVVRLDSKSLSLLEDMSGRINEKKEWTFLYLAQLMSILTDAAERSPNVPSALLSDSSFTNTMKPLISYINEHYASISALDELAEALHRSKSYLCRVFRQETGMTISYYINYLKIQYACHRLTDSRASVSAVALESGFESASYFNRIFRKYTGVTPGEFRSSLLSSNPTLSSRQYLSN